MRLPASALPRWTKRLRLRFRLRLWMLMIIVAVVAVGLAWKRRWEHCQSRAGFYETKATLFFNNADMWNSWATDFDALRSEELVSLFEGAGSAGRPRNKFRDLAGRFDRKRAEFEHAAWNPLAPMPTEIDPKEYAMPIMTW